MTPVPVPAPVAAAEAAAAPAGPDPAGAEAASLRLDDALRRADPVGSTLPADAAVQAAREAVALAQRLGRRHDEGRARAWLCSHLLRLGDHAQALAEGPAALALLQDAQHAALRGELLRVMTMCASETGAYDVALDAAHELVRLSAELRDDSAALQAAYSLAVCFERMGDSWQATRLLTRALAHHGSGVPDLPLLIALNAVCAISIGLMHRLRDVAPPAEVRAVLERGRVAGEQARSLLALLTDTSYEVAVLGNLGEVLLHLGEVAAAEPLLLESQRLARQYGLRAHLWRVDASLGSWLLATGQPAVALARMEAMIEDAAGRMPPQTLIRVHDVAYRACRQLQRFEQALTHFEVLERTERRRATAQLQAQSQLLVTRAETQQAQWLAEQSQREAQRQRERAAHFAESAERDPLTGLGNRRHFERRSAELLPTARREGRPLSLAMIDIDHFKAVNDSHGHTVGDTVLVTLAQVLRDNTRAGDVLARFGGEEFVVLLPDMPLLVAVQVCERLAERIAGYRWQIPQAPGLAVTISVGLVAAPGYEADTLLARADAALYRAKREGRNRVVVGERARAVE